MVNKTLRQAIKALAQALDDPRFDDWDDDMILTVLGEIINRHRQHRTEVTFRIHGAQIITGEAMDDMLAKFRRYLGD